MLSVSMLSVIMLNAIRLNAVMLSVLAPFEQRCAMTLNFVRSVDTFDQNSVRPYF